MKQEIFKFARDYFAQLNTKLMENLDELDFFLGKHNLPRLTLLYMENINKFI